MGRKSAKIAAKKGAADKQRGQVFTRALKDVYKAAKSGGTDPASNFLLKVALERCKKFNVPKDNIERALKKASGPDGVGFEDINYEGYGPNGVAVFVEASTDNVTRTVANVRSYFNKCGGSLGVNGALEFLFDRKAYFIVPIEGLDEDEFTLEMIDAGAEEVEKDEEFFEVTGPVDVFGTIQDKLQSLDITPEEATLERFPTSYKDADEETRAQVEKLIGLLEDDDDVVTVYHNLEEEE
ncbi:YebC/PmpR family DNA-binding transcriptional regulator [Halobacteriovorax sp. GB3]|uniref:YebC/PmpR family DNA-binding transcriptional regulator n=1 Tax=Halobacteriovorax sp. GB3 TaxID=2719615 RepID=UPI002362A8B9|nr:YebC/PmpR family DNA-binding transcriptional regulator [Halobacteriovorax sp. GB3]MDD0854354.1 YebC/PmpR family DNA-binding transcriptional regulator [Halobacteriovorax sp. GB3]